MVVSQCNSLKKGRAIRNVRGGGGGWVCPYGLQLCLQTNHNMTWNVQEAYCVHTEIA